MTRACQTIRAASKSAMGDLFGDWAAQYPKWFLAFSSAEPLARQNPEWAPIRQFALLNTQNVESRMNGGDGVEVDVTSTEQTYSLCAGIGIDLMD